MADSSHQAIGRSYIFIYFIPSQAGPMVDSTLPTRLTKTLAIYDMHYTVPYTLWQEKSKLGGFNKRKY